MRMFLLHNFYTFMDQSINVTKSFKNRKYNPEARTHIIIIHGSCKIVPSHQELMKVSNEWKMTQGHPMKAML